MRNGMAKGSSMKRKQEKKTYFLSTITNIYHSEHFFLFLFCHHLYVQFQIIATHKKRNLRFTSCFFFACIFLRSCSLFHTTGLSLFRGCLWHSSYTVHSGAQAHTQTIKATAQLAVTHSLRDLQLWRFLLLIFYFLYFLSF